MSEEIQWITINGARIPLNEQGEPMSETGAKILSETKEQPEQPKTDPQKADQKSSETNRETGKTITKSDGIAYSKTYGEYLEERGGDHYGSAIAFFKEQLQGKVVTCETPEGKKEIHFTEGTLKKLQFGLKQDSI